MWQIISGFRLFFSWKGRIDRSTLLLGRLGLYFVFKILIVQIVALHDPQWSNVAGLGPAYPLFHSTAYELSLHSLSNAELGSYSFFLICFGLLDASLYIKRIRDTGHSPWWCLLLLVPIADVIFGLYCLFAKSKEDESAEQKLVAV